MRPSSTKGRQLAPAGPSLSKGAACLCCRTRKVRCDGKSTCSACLRLAKFEGKRPEEAICEYSTSLRRKGSQSRVKPTLARQDSPTRSDATSPDSLQGVPSSLPLALPMSPSEWEYHLRMHNLMSSLVAFDSISASAAVLNFNPAVAPAPSSAFSSSSSSDSLPSLASQGSSDSISSLSTAPSEVSLDITSQLADCSFPSPPTEHLSPFAPTPTYNPYPCADDPLKYEYLPQTWYPDLPPIVEIPLGTPSPLPPYPSPASSPPSGAQLGQSWAQQQQQPQPWIGHDSTGIGVGAGWWSREAQAMVQLPMALSEETWATLLEGL